MTATIVSPVANGKLVASARESIIRVLQGYEGKTVRIEIKQYRKRRSTNQNAFYYGVVLPMVCGLFAQHGGNGDQEMVHRFLKGEVGGMKVAVMAPDGSFIWYIESSVDLTTDEWENWIDKIRAWAAPFDLEIPFPNEVL